ncbi:10080_t:CDS:2 [Acaulospora colombiana]|uniref:10080_t:CDS:1 n=1 Tax=Acaulospora colombiana TaxID=27376 RepID=A0ACA9LEL8_9GLOM|nr:10080_t:CDS:2 [Acaulospora colombiana]
MDSFFDFDTTLPPLNSEKFAGTGGNHTSGENFEVFDYEQNFDLANQLEESGDDMNDETFGVTVDMGEEFDFIESTTKIADTIQREEEIYVGRRESSTSDNGFGPSPPTARTPMSLEQIEAQLHRQAGISEKRMLALLGINERPPHPLYPTTDASRYNGLMTQSDKDYINRIQISQLVTDDPYADDFYYQVYTAIRTRQQQPQMSAFSPQAGGTGFMGHERGRHRSRGSESGLLKMQQQVLRIVNDARRKPKMTQLSLEGALGKIALNSVRNPRQILQVSSKNTDAHNHAGPSNNGSVHQHHKTPSISSYGITDHRKVFRSIENIYTAVLTLEELKRSQPQRIYTDYEREAYEKWKEEYAEVARTMWKELRVTEMIGVG